MAAGRWRSVREYEQWSCQDKGVSKWSVATRGKCRPLPLSGRRCQVSSVAPSTKTALTNPESSYPNEICRRATALEPGSLNPAGLNESGYSACSVYSGCEIFGLNAIFDCPILPSQTIAFYFPFLSFRSCTLECTCPRSCVLPTPFARFLNDAGVALQPHLMKCNLRDNGSPKCNFGTRGGNERGVERTTDRGDLTRFLGQPDWGREGAKMARRGVAENFSRQALGVA